MYAAAVSRDRFLAEVREHKRIPRVRSLPYASLGGKKRGLQLHYEVAARRGDERIKLIYAEILLAKLVDDDRRIEPRWIVNFGGSLLDEMQKKGLAYETEVRAP